MLRKKLLLVLTIMVSSLLIYEVQAQTLANPYTVTTFPTTITNINTGSGETATGMGGSCFTLPCCSVNVFKVTLPSDGVLRVEMNGFTPLAGSIIAYYPNTTNVSSFSDLTYISSSPGNFCGFRDTLLLGRAFKDWHLTSYGQTPTNVTGLTSVYDFNNPTYSNGYFPAGDYYLLVFNENQQTSQGVGSTVELTFEFAESCSPLTMPSAVQFDTLEPNGGLDTVSFFVKNNRDLDVTISNANITGGDSTDFTVITAPSSTIPTGDSTLVSIEFAPTESGLKSSTFEVSFSDTNCSTSTSLTLQGTGAESEMNVLGNSTSIANNDLTPSINNLTNMGAVITNTGSVIQTYQITNTGSDTLEFSGNPIVALSGNSQFVVSSQPSSIILPGDTTTFEVTFTPTVDGTVTTDVSIANNDADQNPFTFRLEATGAERNGLHFDGSNDYSWLMALTSDMVGVNTWTMEAWIKPDQAQSGLDHIIAVNTSGSGNVMLLRLDDGFLDLYDGSTAFEVGPDLRDNQWHHVAASYDNGALVLYVDGSIEGTFTASNISFASNDRWSLGQEFDGSTKSDFFKGAMDEIRIWDVVRSHQEIADARYCEIQSPTSQSNLLLYFTMNQGVSGGNNSSIQTLTDASGNSNSGLLYNFAMSGTTSNFVSSDTVGTNCFSESVTICDATSYTTFGGSTYNTSGLYVDTLINSSGGDSIVYTSLSINYFEATQSIIADTTVCDTLLVGAQTEFTPFAQFEKSNENWIDVSGVVGDLVNTNRSIFLWMKAAGQVSGDNQVLVGINSSGTATITNMMIRADEDLDLYDGSNYQTTNTVVTDGAWHHVGYTYDETTNITKTYIDGVEVDSYTNGQSISATDRISLGQEFDGTTASDFFDGVMADVTFWNEVLDTADINLLMKSAVQTSHPKYANLKAYYPMVNNCNDDGLTVIDYSPSGYDGAASANTIIVTDSLAEITGYNAAPLYNKSWTRNGTQVATTDSLELTSAIQAGTYGLDLTLDYFNVSDSWNVTVQPSCAGIVASITTDSNVTCNGLANGGATATVTGGTTPYTYLWSNGATTASITGVAAGTYSVTITDNNASTDTASVTIVEPAALIAASVVDSNVSCNGLVDGGATASATGGTTPYTYIWNNAATTASITGVGAGTYSVTVTDNNGCYDSSSVTVTEPTLVIVSAVLDSNEGCVGSLNGGATASATGGTPAYNYLWSNAATTASITGLGAGTYSVTVSDMNGCTDSSSVVISSAPVASIIVNVDSTVSCNGLQDGGLTASATGGGTPYNYLWSNGATTASITGLGAGTYSVTLTESGGCTSVSSGVVTEPAVLVSSTALDSNASCNGLLDGGATASATGGTMPYNYMWSNAATTASITGVSAGTYSVTITDNKGCTDSSSVVVTEPAVLVSSTALDSNASCNGLLDGGATASATGGTMPYNYMWSNAATTASITGVSAGTYSVTITDNKGCTDSSSVVVTEPAVLTSAAMLDSTVSCNGFSDGGSTASAIGGTMPYNYMWSNAATTASITGVSAGTYSVTITDNKGCTDSSSVVVTEPVILATSLVVNSNESCAGQLDGDITSSASGGTAPYTYAWSNGATTANITGLSAGVYTATVTDFNGCFSVVTDSVIISDVTTPTVITRNITVYLDSNGQASITASMIDSASFDACGIDTLSLNQYGFTCSEVGANTVTLAVTDVNGNTDSATATVTVMDTLNPTVLTQNVTVYLDANGQASIATTDIDNGSYDNCSIQTMSLDSTLFDCSEVGANTVTLTVTDVNGNADSATATITVMDTLNPTVLTQNVTVYLDASGQANITTSLIDNGSYDNCSIQTMSLDSTLFDCSEVGANTVTLTVTDVNGNADSATATITVMDTLNPTVLTQNVTVYLDASGQANITTSLIDNGSYDNCSIQTISLDSTLFDCSEVGANTVTLTVTDVNGNADSATATVTVLDTIYPILTLDVDTSICATDTTGAEYMFNVSGSDNCSTGGVIQTNGLPSGSIFPIGITTNVFEITDASGNTTVDSFTVEVFDYPVLSIDSIDVLCETGAAITLSALPTGGVFSGTGVTGNMFDPTAVSAGSNRITYTYTTTEGCVYSTDVYAQVNWNPDVYIGVFADTVCIENGVVACPVGTPSGGVYSGAGVENVTLNTDSAGVGMHYVTYTYTDQYGCTGSDSSLANIIQCLDAVGVREVSESGFTYSLYPNPNRGRFILKHNSTEPLSCSIYSTNGMLVKSVNLNSMEQEITIGNQAQGMYLIRITGNGVSEQIRITVY